MEFPWVLETQSQVGPDGVPIERRNPLWGILAIGAAGVCAFMLLLALFMGRGFGSGGELLLPIWGTVTLLAVGLAINAIVKKGAVNLGLGIGAMALVIMTNPVGFLLLGSLASLF